MTNKDFSGNDRSAHCCFLLFSCDERCIVVFYCTGIFVFIYFKFILYSYFYCTAHSSGFQCYVKIDIIIYYL